MNGRSINSSGWPYAAAASGDVRQAPGLVCRRVTLPWRYARLVPADVTGYAQSYRLFFRRLRSALLLQGQFHHHVVGQLPRVVGRGFRLLAHAADPPVALCILRRLQLSDLRLGRCRAAGRSRLPGILARRRVCWRWRLLCPTRSCSARRYRPDVAVSAPHQRIRGGLHRTPSVDGCAKLSGEALTQLPRPGAPAAIDDKQSAPFIDIGACRIPWLSSTLALSRHCREARHGLAAPRHCAGERFHRAAGVFAAPSRGDAALPARGRPLSPAPGSARFRGANTATVRGRRVRSLSQVRPAGARLSSGQVRRLSGREAGCVQLQEPRLLSELRGPADGRDGAAFSPETLLSSAQPAAPPHTRPLKCPIRAQCRRRLSAP